MGDVEKPVCPDNCVMMASVYVPRDRRFVAISALCSTNPAFIVVLVATLAHKTKSAQKGNVSSHAQARHRHSARVDVSTFNPTSITVVVANRHVIIQNSVYGEHVSVILVYNNARLRVSIQQHTPNIVVNVTMSAMRSTPAHRVFVYMWDASMAKRNVANNVRITIQIPVTVGHVITPAKPTKPARAVFVSP